MQHNTRKDYAGFKNLSNFDIYFSAWAQHKEYITINNKL